MDRKLTKPIRVLLVDDKREMRETLWDMLALDPDFRVIGAVKNGLEGVAMALTLRPDIILMNCSMPMMDGIEATRRIMRIMPDAAIIMLSCYDDPVIVTTALQAGVRTYLRKPIENIEVLYNAMRSAYETNQSSSERPTHPAPLR